MVAVACLGLAVVRVDGLTHADAAPMLVASFSGCGMRHGGVCWRVGELGVSFRDCGRLCGVGIAFGVHISVRLALYGGSVV